MPKIDVCSDDLTSLAGTIHRSVETIREEYVKLMNLCTAVHSEWDDQQYDDFMESMEARLAYLMKYLDQAPNYIEKLNLKAEQIRNYLAKHLAEAN
ncbi:MAG: hypothetical protein ACM3QZ_01910 [Solirubrobacterales bacterium]